MDAAGFALAAAAAAAAGFANAIAGGGTLITFPALLACGLPPVVANVTNTVALCPGYLGATLAQRRELAGQRARAARLLPVAAAGGVGGALLLLATGEAGFSVAVPFLLVFAALLIALQDRLRAWVIGHRHPRPEGWAVAPVAAAAVYGGYFGAGMSVIVLASLAVMLEDTLVRVNALKQGVALAVNVAAAIVFAVAGHVAWWIALVMAVAALAGGAIGGAVASRVPVKLLRAVIVVVGLAVAAIYFSRL